MSVFDVCQCGHFRHEHLGNEGHCMIIICNDSNNCDEFVSINSKDKSGDRK